MSEIEQAKARLARAAEELANANAQVAVATGALAIAVATGQSRVAELTAERVATNELRNSSLPGSVEEEQLKSRIEALDRQIEQAKQVDASLQSNVDSANQRAASAMKELEEANRVLERLQQ